MRLDYELSDHAQKRCQQRGIDRNVIDALLSFGTIVPHRGDERCFMTKRARQLAERSMGHAEYARIADHLDTYLVIRGSVIVTVGHRTKRRVRSKPDRPRKHRESRRRRYR